MTRILEIIMNAEGTVGGEQSHVLQLIDALDRDRFDVDVITWEIPEFEAELAARGVPTTAVTGQRILDRALITLIEGRVRAGGYDLVHAHGHRAGVLGRYAAVRAHAPHIMWTCHVAENKADANPLVRIGYRQALRYLDRHTDVTIAVSSLLRDWLVAEGVPRDSIEVVPNGVDTDRFAPMPKDARLAEDLGLQADVPVIGTVARLTEQKSVETLVEASAYIGAARPDAQVLIVGTGPLESALRARASELQAGGGALVVFAGQRSDVPELLGLFDVAVVPSAWEGAFCYSLLEAMASQTPVVCSDIDMFADVVVSDRDAVVFPVGDARACADAIVALLDDPGRASRIGAAGRELVTSRFSAQASSAETLNIYECVLRGERR